MFEEINREILTQVRDDVYKKMTMLGNSPAEAFSEAINSVISGIVTLTGVWSKNEADFALRAVNLIYVIVGMLKSKIEFTATNYDSLFRSGGGGEEGGAPETPTPSVN